MTELVHGAVRRGGTPVLQAAALPLPERGNIGIVGVNGAGKSTLFHVLAGALRRSDGQAVVRGTEGAIGYAPQQPAFPEWLRVEAVARLFGLDYDGVAARFPGLLLDELANRSAGALSVGQRQVLSVALALALDTRLTLLDEPFAPLDFRRRIGLVRTLQQRRDGPGVTLISSQAAVDLLDTCDWIVVLRAGRYVHSGPPDALSGGGTESAARARFENAIVALLEGDAAEEALGDSRPQARQPAGT